MIRWPGRRRSPSHAQVANDKGELFAGLCRRHAAVGARARRHVIAVSALVVDAQGKRVVTVDANSKARFIRVQVGRDQGERVEIVDGLAGQENVSPRRAAWSALAGPASHRWHSRWQRVMDTWRWSHAVCRGSWFAYGLSLISSALLQVSPELEEAAIVIGASRGGVTRQIIVPFIRFGLLGSSLLIFLIFAREYSTAVYLLGPGTEVMGSMIVSLWGAGAIDPRSALSVVNVLLVGAGIFVALRLCVRLHG